VRNEFETSEKVLGFVAGEGEFENGARTPGAPGKGPKNFKFFKKFRKFETYVVCASTRTWTLDIS